MAKDVRVNTSYFNGLINDYRSKILEDTGIVDIITFSEANWGLCFSLFPAQKFILKVTYGLPLDDGPPTIPVPDELNTRILYNFNEVEFMEFLIETKRINIKEYIPGKTRRELVLVCGRRASKSNIVSVISDYEAYRMIKMGNPQKYFGFPSGQEINITAVATNEEQAGTIFKMIKNRANDCTYLGGRIQGDTQTSFSMFTDDDIRAQRDASIRVICGGAASSALRSKNNLIVIMDEAAFFAKYGKGNGYMVYNALTPSVASFVPMGKTEGEGKIILLSSPFSKSGLFWDKYCESFDYPDDILMFQMYSSMINIRLDSGLLRSAYRQNKDSFKCEYGGEFSDTVESWIDPESLDAVVDKERNFNLLAGDPGVSYYMGIDFGGKNDGASIAITHKENETIILDYAEVYYGSNSDIWEGVLPYYSEVNRAYANEEVMPMNKLADEIKTLCEKFNVVEGWFDQFNGFGLNEFLKERGLTQFEAKNVSQQINIQVFQTTKVLINSGLCKLFDHPVLIPELTSLEEKKDGQRMSVEAPARAGFHDDISDAFCRAVWTAYNSKKDSKKKVTLGVSGPRSGSGGTASYKAYHYGKMKSHGENPRMPGYLRKKF